MGGLFEFHGKLDGKHKKFFYLRSDNMLYRIAKIPNMVT